jgi:[ribosomal protein S5]-alanine N-acetyltransferase
LSAPTHVALPSKNGEDPDDRPDFFSRLRIPFSPTPIARPPFQVPIVPRAGGIVPLPSSRLPVMDSQMAPNGLPVGEPKDLSQPASIEKAIAELRLLDGSSQFPKSIEIGVEDMEIWQDFLEYRKMKKEWDVLRAESWASTHPSHIHDLFNSSIVLESDRLRLRVIEEKDLADSYRILSDSTAMKYFGSKRHPDLEYTRVNWVNLLISRFKYRDTVPFAITLKESGELVGHINAQQFGGDFRYAEIAYIIDPAHWGQGFATEALILMVEYLGKRMKVHKIRANVFAGNIASLRVLEKVGFEREGYLRDNAWINGAYLDEYIMAFFPSEHSNH